MSALHKLICGVVVLASVAAGRLLAQDQAPAGDPPGVSESSVSSESSAATQRQQLLERRRWRHLQQLFHEWLAVQDIYTPEEIAELKTRLQQRIQGMTAPELEDFMDDAEERLNLLLSDEAMQARTWLNFFTPQARREMVASNGEIPDVLDMSVSQLRRELDQFRQERAERGATQAALNR